jgi:signal peptidase I
VEDSFGHGQTLPQEASISYPYTLEKNKYFLLGDNRENSVDSRSFGAVYRGQILGKVIHQ